MPRRQVEDLQDVNLGGAARQVNTFVAAPRARRTNSALQLSAALSGVAQKVQQHQERESKLDVKQATANKLYGGTLFTNTVDEATADYETSKDQFKTVGEAAEYYLQRTTPEEPFQDVHQEAGFREAQEKALGKFRGAHAQYLAQQRQEQLGRDVLNDFFLTTKTADADEAFKRLRTIADNYEMSKDEIDEIPLGAAEILISQGRFDEARSILENKRGGAGSLVDRPNTAIQANKLLSKLDTEDSINVANQIKELEDTTESNSAFTQGQKVILDNLLESDHLTINQRNKLLQANEQAVKIDNLSDSLATNLSQPGRTFFDQIPGASREDSEKARKRFTEKFYQDAEDKRSSGKIDPLAYSKRVVAFSEQTNTVNPAVKQRLGAGFSAFSPQDILTNSGVDQQTVASIAEYITMYNQNANVASAHVANNDQLDFFDAIAMDVKMGGLPGDTSEKIERALKNYANDQINPLEGTSSIRVSDEEIQSEWDAITARNTGTLSPFDDDPYIRQGAASNAEQWIPYIKSQVKAAARRTGGSDKAEIIEHIVEQINSRSQRIGDYLVPKGTNTYTLNSKDLNRLNNNAVSRYIAENPEDGYDPDDLILTPIVGQKNLWGVTVKGSNQILETIPHTELPISGTERTPTGAAEEPVGKQGSLETESNTKLAQNDKDLLDFIAQPESNGNYNVVFGGRQEPLTDMTVGDVLALQKTMKSSGQESTAVGRYQFINKTLTELVSKMDIPKDAQFDEALQDRLAHALLERRGLSDFRSGKITPQKFALNLAKEWASLPKDASNESFYKGVGSNKALVGFDELINKLT